HPEPVLRSMELLLSMWEELRSKAGPFHLRMRGTSMWPAVPEGSLIAVFPCPTGELRRGDLVTFRRGGSIVTHRVVRVDERGRVRAWGDSLATPDAWLEPPDVLGRGLVLERGSLGSLGRIARVLPRFALSSLLRARARSRRDR